MRGQFVGFKSQCYLERDVVDVILGLLAAVECMVLMVSVPVDETMALFVGGRFMIGVLLQRFNVLVGSKSMLLCSAAEKPKTKKTTEKMIVNWKLTLGAEFRLHDLLTHIIHFAQNVLSSSVDHNEMSSQ